MEIQQFFCHLNFTWSEIIIWWIETEKNVIFSHFRGSESNFWWICAILQGRNLPKSKFRASKTVKMTIFGHQNLPKWISHKIWVAKTPLNFHTVRFLFWLPRSVHRRAREGVDPAQKLTWPKHAFSGAEWHGDQCLLKTFCSKWRKRVSDILKRKEENH